MTSETKQNDLKINIMLFLEKKYENKYCFITDVTTLHTHFCRECDDVEYEVFVKVLAGIFDLHYKSSIGMYIKDLSKIIK